MAGVKTLKDSFLIPIVTVSEKDNIIDVAKKIHKFQERRIFVINAKKFPVGIISLVDINDRVVAKGRDLKKTKAADVMTRPVKLVFDITTPLEEAKKRMIRADNYYCPVVEKGKIKGLTNYSGILEVLGKKHGSKS